MVRTRKIAENVYSCTIQLYRGTRCPSFRLQKGTLGADRIEPPFSQECDSGVPFSDLKKGLWSHFESKIAAPFRKNVTPESLFPTSKRDSGVTSSPNSPFPFGGTRSCLLLYRGRSVLFLFMRFTLFPGGDADFNKRVVCLGNKLCRRRSQNCRYRR